MRNYLFNADIGSFEIRQTGHERYQLWIGEELLGEYESPEKAAGDVAAFNTGYPEWDRLENEYGDVPKSLEDWAPLTEESPQA